MTTVLRPKGNALARVLCDKQSLDTRAKPIAVENDQRAEVKKTLWAQREEKRAERSCCEVSNSAQ